MTYIKVVGYDYAQTVLELSHRMTYADIGREIGYSGAQSVEKIANRGVIPAHDKGEALWALYCDTFGRKPPRTAVQARGLSQTSNKSDGATTTVAPCSST